MLLPSIVDNIPSLLVDHPDACELVSEELHLDARHLLVLVQVQDSLMQLVCGIETLKVGALRLIREYELDAVKALDSLLGGPLKDFDFRELVVFR